MKTSCPVVLLPLLCSLVTIAEAQMKLQPTTMKRVAEVSPRYVSYNIEAVEVTGGRFWKPYGSTAKESQTSGNQPGAMDPSLYEFRPPIDLSNAKLRGLAAALGPAYLRVSGTWRNFTYFQDDDQPASKTPPAGYNGVMTRAEWKGVIDFAHAVNAELVTSVAVSAGTRDADGKWTPAEAKKFFDATKRLGGHVAATEFMNEPTFPDVGGAPKGYTAAMYGEDVKTFTKFMKSEAPDVLYLGPGSVGEGLSLAPEGTPAALKIRMLDSHDLMASSGPVYDIFSYHFYPTASSRCLGSNATKSDVVLTPAWFARNITVYDFYAKIRDASIPGKDIWLTETGEAGCGGDPWSSQFADTFRYVHQLGSLAQRGVKTVMQNTLAASDYAFLNPQTLDPRPKYWAALLWKRTMGTRVLDPGVPATEGLSIYAHCMPNARGGVTLVALNTSKDAAQTVSIPVPAERYTITSPALFSSSAMLNGHALTVGDNGSLPEMKAVSVKKGVVSLAPLSISFLTMPDARNAACQ
ncbi:hypothetical protein [Terriglobus roseus]|uniref:Glycosyl hydrolase family 79, N-terminal domain n=1 Tax=Terriglobus roseus TaxID=392734 RepID=A0A1H4L442_9BACT|nr:hypothetical protein [Terriglobus roseus]SEB65115.1 Glycosyl hydrolase family 79, N-terminal domain [Terriglobus roseus]